MDVMLDLETLDSAAGAIILSIGACVFDRSVGHVDGMPKLHTFVRPQEQLLAGAKVSMETFFWWIGQSDEARAAMLAGQANAVRYETALAAFDTFIDTVKRQYPGEKLQVWGNGADFDQPILRDLYRRAGRDVPWAYNAGRCMRTILDLAGCTAKDILPAPTGAHDALVDAIYQSNVVASAIRRITSA